MVRRKREMHELVPFLALWAADYARNYRLNGLHPVHYDLLKKYGARMDSFTRATGHLPLPPSHAPVAGD